MVDFKWVDLCRSTVTQVHTQRHDHRGKSVSDLVNSQEQELNGFIGLKKSLVIWLQSNPCFPKFVVTLFILTCLSPIIKEPTVVIFYPFKKIKYTHNCASFRQELLFFNFTFSPYSTQMYILSSVYILLCFFT